MTTTHLDGMEHKPSVLITGCGKGGIGHALARQFIEGGYMVITTLLPHEAQDHLKELGAHVFVSDVTSDSDGEALRLATETLLGGRLDVLINNAGIIYTMPAVDLNLAQVDRMFAVNVLGPMRMVKLFHRHIVQASGTIVNIGSVGGVVPYIYGSSYNASKAALHAYGNTLRAEMKPFGVRVINVISGEIGTNLLKREAGAKISDDSIFRPLSKEFEDHIRRTPKTTPPNVYAAAVFRETQRTSPAAWFWTGNLSTIVRILDTLLPRTFWDWMFAREFHFDRLRRALGESRHAKTID